MKDLAKLKLLRWIPFALGLAFGLILSGWIFAWVFTQYASDPPCSSAVFWPRLDSAGEDNRKPSVGHCRSRYRCDRLSVVVDDRSSRTASPNMIYLMIGGAVERFIVLPACPVDRCL